MHPPRTAADRTQVDLKSGFRPLYTQVRDMLVQRMAQGHWRPGAALPSEHDLAAELGVSQGTVRKALDELTAQNLVVRRQGRGTFVAEHDEARILFQFFKIAPDTGEPCFPKSRILSAERRPGTIEECLRLDLVSGAEVIHVRRLRLMQGKPAIMESVTLPAGPFAGLADREGASIPNNLYELYAGEYGVTVAEAIETLKAVALEPEPAERLGVPAGHPALRIERLARALDGSPVEWRVGLCLTDTLHYRSDLI
jgi:GntR family transcriptional regulator